MKTYIAIVNVDENRSLEIFPNPKNDFDIEWDAQLLGKAVDKESKAVIPLPLHTTVFWSPTQSGDAQTVAYFDSNTNRIEIDAPGVIQGASIMVLI